MFRKIRSDPLSSDTLKGNRKGCREVCKGNYRIIFRIDNNNIVRILKIGHRKHVYKKINKIICLESYHIFNLST
jgi:mRNA-degrading endonuclease RelE of RelBE toxin-antitoxin system